MVAVSHPSIMDTKEQRNGLDSTGERKAFGLSMRGWLAFLVVWTYCLLAVQKIEVSVQFQAVVIMVVTFYFGQKSIQPKA
jgi:hypothetical protein